MKTFISNKALCDAARSARKRSYSPYSNISVGAALLCGSGKVYEGANIENAAYSPCVCAERVAFFSAINAGEREFLKIAISGGRREEDAKESFTPCGVCRQVMAEFCEGNFEILLSEDKSIKLSDAFPYAFNEDALK